MSCPPSNPGMVYNAICPSLTEFIIAGALALLSAALLWYSQKHSGNDEDVIYTCYGEVETETVSLEDDDEQVNFLDD